jgi:hypothetical protein
LLSMALRLRCHILPTLNHALMFCLIINWFKTLSTHLVRIILFGSFVFAYSHSCIPFRFEFCLESFQSKKHIKVEGACDV